jgi:acyl-coenzyme A synthetase/AMP-(fatty) acid ligase
VDEVILDHPAVAQVVTFAVPHPKLGEDVAAAVVLKEGQALTERELQQFVGQRLADMKVPRKVLFVAEIPKGATGKLQRIGLAAKLGLG